MTAREVELLGFVSMVRTCPDSPPCCRAAAAALLGEPTVPCPRCGHPTLQEAACGCARHEGGNPAARHWHELTRPQDAAA